VVGIVLVKLSLSALLHCGGQSWLCCVQTFDTVCDYSGGGGGVSNGC